MVKVALITGGNSGIGKATALLFAHAEYTMGSSLVLDGGNTVGGAI